MTESLETAENPGQLKRVVIEPLTRVEGHGKVTLLQDEHNQIRQARLHIVEFRGFEKFIQGRPYWELPVLVQRLCGICPVSHHLCAAKAVDGIIGAERLTPTAEKMRRLMHYGQMFQSHALHFFHLCSPDILFGFEADPAIRNVVGVAKQFPDLAVQGVMMRKYGQEIIKATAGKKIHGTGAIPGGMNKNLSIAERDELLKDVDQMMEWSRGALKIAKDYTMEHLAELKPFGSFESNHMSLVRQDGAMDLYHGRLRASDEDGRRIFDVVDYNHYWERISEEVKPWSYMKFPYLMELGPERGCYRVGPLTRVTNCDFIPTPLADRERRELLDFDQGRVAASTLGFHWARMIEMLHAAEAIKELLHDADLLGDELLASGERQARGVGVIEAPRGTLIHHYHADAKGSITKCNLIVSTTHNNEPMNEAVRWVAANELEPGMEITDSLLNRFEVAIRAYDPCLSCATHAMGRMPLIVEVLDADGRQVAERVREGA